MDYKFTAYGHPNIIAAHKITLEFTKDNELSLKGDCIVGVNADFDLGKLKGFISKSKNKKITITLQTISSTIKIKETMHTEINQNFNDNKEFVIRKTNFVSDRTFAINSNKAAFNLNRTLIAFLKEKKNKISVVIENKE